MQAYAIPAYGAQGIHAFAAARPAARVGVANQKFAANDNGDTFVPKGAKGAQGYESNSNSSQFGILATLGAIIAIPLVCFKAICCTKLAAIGCAIPAIGCIGGTKLIGCW